MTGTRIGSIGAVAAMIAVVVAALTGASRAVAAGRGAGTVCRFATEFSISPGLSAFANSGSFTSIPGQGRLDCQGAVRGARPIGPGSFSAAGRYGTADPDSCLSGGEGTALQSFRLPTTDGELAFTNDVAFTWRPLPSSDGHDRAPLRRWLRGAVISGEFEGEAGSGTFEVVALEGDCVTAPVTRVAFTARAVFRD
jgi:hypothetical protein